MLLKFQSQCIMYGKYSFIFSLIMIDFLQSTGTYKGFRPLRRACHEAHDRPPNDKAINALYM